MSVQPQLFEQQGACVRLVAQYRNARQPVRRLTNVLTLLGRGEGCDIILSSTSVGISHAAIVRLGTTAYVCDLGAQGGTQLDGRYVRWARLHDGAELVLGRFKYRVELEGGDLAVGTAAPPFALMRDDDRVATTSEDPILVIGSGEGCDVQSTEAGVAGRHALIVWSQHGPVIRDLSTQTGTRHNGRTVTIARLLSGDTIGVGGLELTFKIDMMPGIEGRMAGGDSDGAPSVAPLVAGRLDESVAPKLEDLWPANQPRINEKNIQAETRRDLTLLNEASRSLAESQARVESSFDGAALLSGLDATPSSMVEFGSGIIAEPAAAMMAEAMVGAQASATVDPKGDDRAATERGKDVLLESTMRLQSRRDQDKRRIPRPGPRRDDGADMSAAPPVGGDAGLRDDDVTDDADWTPERNNSAPAAAPRANSDDRVSAAMWQKAAARLEMELTEAREELKRAKQKYAQHMELHGSIDARNRKIDQRLNELRSRVAGAQEAMDERARALRVGLEAERERLRLQHLDIQRKNDELEQVAARQRDEVQQAFNAERAELERARNELMAEREALSNLRTEFESEVSLARADQMRVLDDQGAAYQKRIDELNERQRAIEQAAAEDAERREQAFAWRENELAERRRALELEHESLTRKLEADLDERRKAIEQEKQQLARAREQQSAEARSEFESWQRDARQALEIERKRMEQDLATQRAELEAARADHGQQLQALKQAAERETETANRRRIDELNRKESEIAEREEALELRKRRATEVVEENRKRDEEQVNARMRALEEAFAARVEAHDAAFRARAEALEADVAKRQADLDARFKASEVTLVEQTGSLAERRRELEDEFSAREQERQLELATQREALRREFEEIEARRQEEHQRREADLDERRAALQREFDELEARRQEEHRQRESVLEERRAAARSAIERQLEEREAEFAKREEAFVAREKSIENRLAELDMTSAEREQAMNARMAELDQQLLARKRELEEQASAKERAIEARLAEVDEELAQRRQELEAEVAAKEKAIEARLTEVAKSAVERERTLKARMAEADEEIANRKRELEEQAAAELTRQREELDRTVNARLANAELDLAARDSENQSRIDAVTQRESELEQIAEHMRIRGEEIEQREATLGAREQELLARLDAHVAKESEISQLAAALETRNARLMEWQARIEMDTAALESHRDEAERARGSILVRQQEIDQRSAELEARFAELLSGRSGLKTERELIDGRATEIEAREAQLRRREEQLERSREELADDERRVNEARDEVRELDRKVKLLDERSAELGALSEVLASRERLLAERVTTHEQHLEEFETHRRELESIRIQLDAERREFEVKAHGLDERMARAEAFEQRIRQSREELEQDRQALAAEQAAHAAKAAAFESQTRALTERISQLDSEQNDVRMAQEQIAQRERDLIREKTELSTASDRVTADRAALELFKSHVDEQQAAFARQQSEFAARVSAFEAERSRLERDKLMNRDQGRDLSTERTSVESARAEIERLQAELKTGIDENHLIRKQLMETRDRLRSRKRRLIDDVANLEGRQKQLEQEIEQTRKMRNAVDVDREAIADERRRLANEQDAVKSERESLDQAKRTFQAGMREVEAREKVVTDRELELADHARKLEEYRTRLEEEYTDIEKQRQDLLETQKGGTDEAERVSVLMEQTDAMRLELRNREEELATLEKAVAARAAELTAAEEANRRKAADFDESLSRIEAGRRQLEQERKAFMEAMENERDDAMTARRQAEAQIAEQRAALERRMREFEAEVAAQRAALEDEEHATHEAALSEMRQRVEAELSDRFATARQREEEIEKRSRLRLEEVERDIQERLARFEEEIRRRRELSEQDASTRQVAVSEDTRAKQAVWDSQLEELRKRQETLNAEHARLRAEREDFDAMRRDFEARRQLTALEADPADDDVDQAAATAVLETRRRELDERERALEARARQLDESATEMRIIDVDGGELVGFDDDTAAPSKLSRVDTAPYAASPSLPRRSLVGMPLAVALGMGVLFGAVIYNILPAQPVKVQGVVQFKSDAPPSMVRMDAHKDAIMRSVEAARQNGGVDLAGLPQKGAIDLNPDVENRRLDVIVEADNATVPTAESWLKAIGDSYRTELDKAAKSQEEVARRLSELTQQRTAKRNEIDAARAQLQEYQTALDADPQAREVEKTQVALKQELNAAEAAVTAAQKALDEAQAKPLTEAPITPSEKERMAVYKGDAQLSQKMEQRDTFARELHAQMVKCIDGIAGPLAKYQTAIGEFRNQIDARRKEQKDRDILSQLEQVAVGVSDLRDQARDFASELGDLAPKIRKWKGGDVKMLLEYQRAAEDLILRLDRDSRTGLIQTAKDADTIREGGAEPTQRKVIHAALKKAGYGAAVAFSDLTKQAAAILTGNNKQILTLRRSIRDLSDGIDQKQAVHDSALTQHLAAIRADQHASKIAGLREARDAALKRKDAATTAFVNQVEQAIQNDKVASERIATLRKQRDEQDDRVRALDLELMALDNEATVIKKEGRTGLADFAEFSVETPSKLDSIDRKRLYTSAGVGGGVAAMFLAFAALAISSKRR